MTLKTTPSVMGFLRDWLNDRTGSAKISCDTARDLLDDHDALLTRVCLLEADARLHEARRALWVRLAAARSPERADMEELMAETLGYPRQGDIPELRSGDPATDNLRYTGGYTTGELVVILCARVRDLMNDIARLKGDRES